MQSRGSHTGASAKRKKSWAIHNPAGIQLTQARPSFSLLPLTLTCNTRTRAHTQSHRSLAENAPFLSRTSIQTSTALLRVWKEKVLFLFFFFVNQQPSCFSAGKVEAPSLEKIMVKKHATPQTSTAIPTKAYEMVSAHSEKSDVRLQYRT